MEGTYTGTLAEGISTTMYDATRGYDKNGNIGYLKRTTGGGATLMDELIYSYTANQLTAVADGGDATKGFKDKVNTTDYAYDQAGNMVADANKDLSIQYNHLNLPANIVRNTSGGNTNGLVKHYYAGATKVRMETYEANGTTLIKAYDYLAGMVYQETVAANVSTKTLDFVASTEGRAILTRKVLNTPEDPSTGDKFRFEYSLKDHLGNLRVSCRCGEPSRDQAGTIIPEGQAGAGIEPLAVVQEQHYDPWGLAFKSVSPSGDEGLNDRFKYNGKELVSDLDLGWNDYGARMYMSEIGRWGATDGLGELYYEESNYGYVSNNPILLTDPFGLFPENINEKYQSDENFNIAKCPTCNPLNPNHKVYIDDPNNLYTVVEGVVVNGDGSGPVAHASRNQTLADNTYWGNPLSFTDKQYGAVTNSLGILTDTYINRIPTDFKRKAAYNISKIVNQKPGQIYQGVKRLAKNTSKIVGSTKGTAIGVLLSGGVAVYEVTTDTWNAHTVVNVGLVAGTIVATIGGAPLVLTGIAVYGVLDYAFDIGGKIDKAVGRDSELIKKINNE
jgi:RHS repeat-associated protein